MKYYSAYELELNKFYTSGDQIVQFLGDLNIPVESYKGKWSGTFLFNTYNVYSGIQLNQRWILNPKYKRFEALDVKENIRKISDLENEISEQQKRIVIIKKIITEEGYNI